MKKIILIAILLFVFANIVSAQVINFKDINSNLKVTANIQSFQSSQSEKGYAVRCIFPTVEHIFQGRGSVIFTGGFVKRYKTYWDEISGGVYLETEWLWLKASPVISYRFYESADIFSSKDDIFLEVIMIFHTSNRQGITGLTVSDMDFSFQYLGKIINQRKFDISFGPSFVIIGRDNINQRKTKELVGLGLKTNFVFSANSEDRLLMSPAVYYVIYQKEIFFRLECGITSVWVEKQ